MSDQHRLPRFSNVLLLAVYAALTGSVAADFVPAAKLTDESASAKVHPSLLRLVEETEGPVKAWVFFADKGIRSPEAYTRAIERVASSYNPRAIRRRALRGDNARRGQALFDEHDLPVVQAYVDAVEATGARVHVTSRWVNAVSVYATGEQLAEIARLPSVKKLQPVARSAGIRPPVPQEPVKKPIKESSPASRDGASRRVIDYGASQAQLAQMNLIALHDAGFTGAGVVIGILDTGFERSHAAFNNIANPVNVIAEYDFVDNDGNTQNEPGDASDQHSHGTMILGCIGAYMPGQLVGGAFDASFVLAKTEDTTGEYQAEEDNYVAGLEFIEANGADMATSSLGYIDWYTQADLDGLTAVTTIAVNIFTGNGVHHCNAAGNSGHDSNPATSSLIAPADALQTITCGAVSSSGGIASFSSEGPTADGRVKPELLALGSGTDTVDPYSTTGYTTASGTSLSTPLVAAAVACLIQARPSWTVDQMRARLFETANDYVANGAFDPLYIRGYGIINAYDAYDTCGDAGTIILDRVTYACEGTAGITVNDCGLNLNDAAIESVTVDLESGSEPGVEVVTLTETDPNSAEFVGSIDLSATDGAGILLVTEGDTITATYVDADDGVGGVNVVVTATAGVDCTPPVISDVQTTSIGAGSATVTFSTDEAAMGTVRYGLSCGSLIDSAQGSGYSTTPVVNVIGLQPTTTYFYAVDAADEAGNTATDDNGAACYSFITPESPAILLVDDDDNSPDVRSFYTDALDGLGLDYDVWDTGNSDNEPDAATLSPYEVVIWFTGDEFGGSAGPGAAGETALGTFLDSGGCFFISAQDYYYDRGTTSFMTNYLGMATASSDVGQTTVTGAGSVFAGMGPYTLSYPFTDYSDLISPSGLAELAFSGNNGDAAINKDGVTYRTIFWGFPWEAVASAGDRLALMSATLNWCAASPFEDCNGNQIPDDQDIANGTSQDCNSNGIPDECDIASGTSPDENGNAVPDQCELGSPLVAAEGARYVAVTPQGEATLSVALRVMGDPLDPAVSCIALYVQATGLLGGAPVFQTPAAWGTVHVYGEQVIPETTYRVQAELASGPLSNGASATTWRWGDTDDDGNTGFLDILQMVRGFKEDFSGAAMEAMDQEPCTPDRAIGFLDMLDGVDAFKNLPYASKGCPEPCP